MTEQDLPLVCGRAGWHSRDSGNKRRSGLAGCYQKSQEQEEEVFLTHRDSSRWINFVNWLYGQTGKRAEENDCTSARANEQKKLFHTQVSLLDHLIRLQLFRLIVQYVFACLKDVRPVRDGERHEGVLLHQQDGCAFLVDALDRIEN